MSTSADKRSDLVDGLPPRIGGGQWKRHKWGRKTAQLLTAERCRPDTRARGAKLWGCRAWQLLGATPDGDWRLEATWACHHPLCPQCRAARGERWKSKLLPILERNDKDGLALDGCGRIWRPRAGAPEDFVYDATGRQLRKWEAARRKIAPKRYWPLFITLTFRNVARLVEHDSNGRMIANVLTDQVQKAWRTMRETARRRPNSAAGRLWSVVKGGVRVIEITQNPRDKSWHPHLHILVLSDVSFIDKAELSQLWEHYSDAYITDVRAVQNSSKAMKELVKYITKPGMSHHKNGGGQQLQKMRPEHLEELADAVRYKRLIQPFGLFLSLPPVPVAWADRQQTLHEVWGWDPQAGEWTRREWWSDLGVADSAWRAHRAELLAAAMAEQDRQVAEQNVAIGLLLWRRHQYYVNQERERAHRPEREWA